MAVGPRDQRPAVHPGALQRGEPPGCGERKELILINHIQCYDQRYGKPTSFGETLGTVDIGGFQAGACSAVTTRDRVRCWDEVCWCRFQMKSRTMRVDHLIGPTYSQLSQAMSNSDQSMRRTRLDVRRQSSTQKPVTYQINCTLSYILVARKR